MFAEGGFPFPPPPKKEKTDEEKAAEEAKAAGVTEQDDEETKQTKLAAYRNAQSKPVGEMSAAELGALIDQRNMQFFRKTGGQAAKLTVEDERKSTDPFEQRVQTHLR